ncbi:MAG: leucine-rich repeat domain-containing protein, partial [Alistipes sp.]|nr:leucine-rich repeat domain-containing protein [Alistipes sp.]
MKKYLFFSLVALLFVACTPNEDDNPSRPQHNSKCIHYTATAKIEMEWTFDTFGANIVSHEWDNVTSEGVITFDGDVTTIGDYAFNSCSNLTSVTIPDSVTTIGEDAFAGCYSLTEFNGKFASEDGRCLIVDGVLTYFAPANLTSYTIPDSVTTIGDNAFLRCSNLTSISIPDSVTTIGYGAFAYCDSLTSVTIPDSVTTIGEYAF